MKVADFDFDLPRELIADRPIEPRDAARLLVIADHLTDAHVSDLPDLLQPGDIVVVNDTKVIPARLVGRRGEARVEITLHKALGHGRWQAFAKGARRLKDGDTIIFAPDVAASVEHKGEGGEVTLDFALRESEVLDALERLGAAPLPPYIPRAGGPDARDLTDYQTIFAANPGAVAAPTAGFHFTDGLLHGLAARGIARATLTLHVGAGTFLPLKVENVADHRMHAEWGRIDDATAAFINEARAEGGRVVAVGTTAARLLEAAADDNGRIQPFEGDTDIFIAPGYTFRAIDLLLTNFHLPRSTLFMLVSAFAGLDRMKAAYAHAIAERYRFYSYGDACLVHPAPGVRAGDGP
ncbi:MAG TPA: tRNA preQ1(34) S-adenosylmethionine ribosyltransferase-isomerase QueA [Alphaproteobacteria bacterium]|nr:tRNA preQ1(34) S-adenosylmethionine ribosyltransferase-isomerase QueA [Alphaproteobacteria bacterium]